MFQWIKKHIARLVIISVILLDLALGLTRLGNFAGVDEPYWLYERVPNFWMAVKTGQWAETKINDKPGITTAIVSGLGLPLTDPVGFKSLRRIENELNIPQEMAKMNFALRLPILLTALSLLPLFYWLIKKLTGQKTALVSLIFIGFSPLLLGITLIINPDALFWIFLPLSLLSFLVHLEEKKERYLYLSGVVFGLALLTKYVSNILFPFFTGLIILQYLIFDHQNFTPWQYTKYALKQLFKLSATAIAVFVLFFPAAWVAPQKIILSGTLASRPFQAVYSRIDSFLPHFLLNIKYYQAVFIFGISTIAASIAFLFVLLWTAKKLAPYRFFFLCTLPLLLGISILAIVIFTYIGMPLFNFESILASPKSSFKGNGFVGLMFSDIWALAFGIHPVAFLGLSLALLWFIWNKNTSVKELFLTFVFSAFILLYYFASTINEIAATVRYQIALYPLAFILASMGIRKLADMPPFKRFLPFIPFLLFIFSFSAVSLVSVRPFYFAYASSLLPQKYVLNLKDMGDGSYEAAAWLNNLPDSKNLVIWSDKGGVCEFFVGRCLLGFDKKKFTANQVDYLVVSSGRKVRSINSGQSSLRKIIDLKKLYDFKNPAYEIIINNRPGNSVKIVHGDPIIQKQPR